MKEFNVAMIGAGSITKSHVIGYKTMPFYYSPAPAKINLKVLVDVEEKSARSRAEQYGFEEYSTDWKAVVKRKDIDLVDICTPNALHCEMAVAAAEAGKFIYCEKPLTLSNEEADLVCEAARKHGVQTAVGFNKRRFPSVTFAKKLIDDGKIGTPYYYHGTFFQSIQLNDNPATWRNECGPFSEIGCHSIDMARYLFGDITDVCCAAKTFIKDRPGSLGYDPKTNRPIADPDPTHRVKMKAEDFGIFLAKFANGAIGSFEASQICSGHTDGCIFELYGSKGSLKWESRYGGEIRFSKADDLRDQKGFRDIELNAEHKDYFWPFAGFDVNWGDLKAIEIHDMLDAFANNKKFAPDFEDAKRTTQVSMALYESAANDNKWINLC